MELWIVELPGDADGIRQVVVTEPDHVDAIHARISRWQCEMGARFSCQRLSNDCLRR
jgi:hypothetical protein